MPVRCLRAGLAAGMLAAAGAALAQAAAPPALAPRLAVCATCHGPGGQSQLPQMPSLAGQPRVFLENQLVLIREGLRDIPAMQAAMAGITDAEIVALATHFAAQVPAAVATAPDATRVRQGAALSQKLLCGTCHLPDYRGQQQVPRLAGQQEAYLQLSMRQFRDNPGPGRDTIMAATLRGLADAELDQLAHYLATFLATSKP